MSVKRESDWESWDFCIRIAGNTGPRAIIALRQKGYDVRQRSFERENDVFQNDFEAKKDGRLFSATTPEELLGSLFGKLAVRIGWTQRTQNGASMKN